jgi:hypothetical protein
VRYQVTGIPETALEQGESDMAMVLLVLLIALLFGGLGFAVHALWLFALVFAIVWIAGFAFRSGENSRWYHW